MGQIKNIKLHIVTDIKKHTKSSVDESARWCTAKFGIHIPVVTDLAPGNVVFVPTNMESSANMDSLFADNVSVNMLTILASRSLSERRWTVLCCCICLYHHDYAIVKNNEK